MRAVWEIFKTGAHVALLAVLVGCAAANHPGGPVSGGGDFAGAIEIGNGRHLYLECHGRGSPTVILDSGYHNSSDPWGQSDTAAPAVGPAVLPALADEHRVCAYDRPGTLRYPDPSITDRSSAVPMPRTAADVVEDLHALLAAAHIPGPYVLAGHSLGGLFVRLYAQTYPEQVKGVVFVDAFGAEIPRLLGSAWPIYRQQLDEPLPQFANAPTFEEIDIDTSVAQVAAAPPFPPVPTVVLTRTEPFAVPGTVSAEQSAQLEDAWRGGTAALIGLRPQTPHLIATGSDHFIQIHQPDLVVAGVRLVMQRAAR